jgi:hypothetical protein
MASKRLMLVLGLWLTILGVLIIPGGVVSAATGGTTPSLVRFTVENRSKREFSIFLSGPKDYNFTVAPNTTRNFAPMRGVYTFVMFACNVSASGTLDLSAVQTMIVPVCGGSARAESRHAHTTDVSEIIKIVAVTIHNKTKTAISLLLVSESTGKSYYMELGYWETRVLRIVRGDYRYYYTACDLPVAGVYSARVRKPLELMCPGK